VDVLEVLRRRDPSLARSALAEVHRQKAFSLADAEYSKEELERAARLHAHHIALMSIILPEVEVDPESVTGIDYGLAKAFREAWERCADIPPPVDEFYRVVVEELNRLSRSLCSSR
jgi:hypothetical protein